MAPTGTPGPLRKNKSSDGIVMSSPERIAADRLLQRLQQKERKYFDSGDYVLSKSGSSSTVGRLHPSPEGLPNRSTSSIGQSPMKDVCSVENLTSDVEEDVQQESQDSDALCTAVKTQ